MPSTSPEEAVKRLSRLPQNTTCPNCGTFSKYGYSTVCVKYNTFVCNLCKTAHQAVSHRCKSLTMSTWTTGEVLALSSAKTGGNDRARRVWLGNAPPVGAGGRPAEGSDVNVFKRFVVDAYDNRRYFREDDEDGAGDGGDGAGAGAGLSVTATTTTTTAAIAAPPAPPPAAASRRPPPPPPPPAPPAAPDLLDFFGAFDAAAATPPVAAVAPPPPPPPPGGGSASFDPFGGGGGGGGGATAAAIPAPGTASAANVGGGLDPFSGFAATAVAGGSPPYVNDDPFARSSNSSTGSIRAIATTNGMGGIRDGANAMTMATSGRGVGNNGMAMPVMMNATSGGGSNATMMNGMQQLHYQQQQQLQHQYQYHQQHRRQQQQQQQPQPAMMMMMNANNAMMMMMQQQQPRQQQQQQQQPSFNGGTMGGSNYNGNGLAATSGRPAANAVGGMGWGGVGGVGSVGSVGGFIPSANGPASAADGSGGNKPDPFAGLGF